MSEVNSNTYTIMNNPLLQDTDVISAAAGVIQDVLDTMDSYVPVEVNTFADWAYDAGDIVTIVKDGVDYVMPIFTNALNWNGGSDVTWQSSGNPEREIPDAPQRQSYGYGTAITQVETDLTETQKSFHTYMEQTDTYISLIATEEDIEEAQLVSKSLFQITSGQILSVVAQSGVTSSLQEFDRTKAYAVGDQVQYQGVWLEFVQPHAANTDLVWTEVKTVKTQETRITENSTGVELLVTKTGISQLGQDETLYSKIGVEAGRIDLIVQNVGEDGSVTAASIVTAINDQDSSSFVALDADVIYLNGSSIVIAGETAAQALHTDEMSCTYFYQIGANGEFGVDGEAHFYGDVYFEGDYVFGEDVVMSCESMTTGGLTVTAGEGQGSYSLTPTNVPGMVTDLQLIGPTNNQYTLQKKTVGNNSWANVGTFSRATQLGGVWGSGTGVLTVTATPQGDQYVTNHYIEFDGNQSKNFTVSMKAQSTGESAKTTRLEKYCYLVASGSGSTANVYAGPNNSTTGAVGKYPLYLYCDSDYAYISTSTTAPTSPSSDGVIAYRTNSVSIDSITFDAVDQGDPSYDVNDQYIYAYAMNGSTVVQTGSQLIHMTEGNWNSGGKAVNVRLNNSAGTLVTRLWAYSEDPSCGNIHSVGTTPGSWRTYCGSLSKSQIALLQVGTCWAFTVSVNGLSKEFYFILDS